MLLTVVDRRRLRKTDSPSHLPSRRTQKATSLETLVLEQVTRLIGYRYDEMSIGLAPQAETNVSNALSVVR